MNKQQSKKSSANGRVTLKQIADELGMSKATVSLAMNGNSLVADSTRALVLEKMKELGYVYNRRAAGLSKGESHTVGLAVHDFTNPYFSTVCASIEAVLSRGQRMSFLCNTDESVDRQSRFLRELCEFGADGLILCPAIGTRAEDLNALKQHRIPVVLIARDIEGAEADFVGNDDEHALILSTHHMLNLGHQRIAMLGGANRSSVGKQRRQGFVSAMQSAGNVIDDNLMIDCAANSIAAEAATYNLIQDNDNPPTALVCFNDLVALGALSAIYKLGLVPGKDVAVIGCDDIEESSRGYVNLSTVTVEKAAIGQKAAELLLDRLAEPHRETQRIIMGPELQIRETCGADFRAKALNP